MKTLAHCPDSATLTPCLRRWRLPVRCTQTGGRQAALPPGTLWVWGRGRWGETDRPWP